MPIASTILTTANTLPLFSDILAQEIAFDGTKTIDKVSLNLSVVNADLQTMVIGVDGVISFQAANFRDGRNTWTFQPVLHWAYLNQWNSSGTTIQNTLQTVNYVTSTNASDSAPFITYDVFLDRPGIYDLWGRGYTSAEGAYWAWDDDTTDMRRLILGAASGPPEWTKFGTIFSQTGGKHSFAVYLSDTADVVLDQWYFTQNTAFNPSAGGSGHFSPIALSAKAPFNTALRVRTLKNVSVLTILEDVGDDAEDLLRGVAWIEGAINLLIGTTSGNVIDVYLRFQINVPIGARIQSSFIRLLGDQSTQGEGIEPLIDIQILDPSDLSGVVDLAGPSGGDANTAVIRAAGVLASVEWQTVRPSGVGVETLTVDLSAIIQAFIDSTGYSQGDFAIFRLFVLSPVRPSITDDIVVQSATDALDAISLSVTYREADDLADLENPPSGHESITSWLSSKVIVDSGKFNYAIQDELAGTGIVFNQGLSLEFWQLGGTPEHFAAWNFKFTDGDSVGDTHRSTDSGQTFTMD